MKYQPVIGLEIHIELATKSKMFCACSANYFGVRPNTLTCPICLGLPGSLPKPNQIAIEYTQKLGLALNCHVQLSTKFDRKNYFYPDLPKGFQISQYDLPLSQNGFLTIQIGKKEKKIGIRRAHLEEDTAKLSHALVNSRAVTLIDFNRSGIPLMEVVSEPEINSAEEAKIFAQKLQQIVRYLGISDAGMEKGSMRIEPNISLRKKGSGTLPNYKVELKNINSFKFVEDAINYEIARQRTLLDSDQRPIQETRGWNENKKCTISQRSKEAAHDYRYFPEPDLTPLTFTNEEIARLKSNFPELPDQIYNRFTTEYQLAEDIAFALTREKYFAHFFEETVGAFSQTKQKGTKSRVTPQEAKRVANFIINEYFGVLAANPQFDKEKVLPAQLAKLLYLRDLGKITSTATKQILSEMLLTGVDPDQIMITKEYAVVSDMTQLTSIVEQVIATNTRAVEDFRKGKIGALEFLIGQVARQTQGRAGPEIVRKVLKEKLKKPKN